MKKAGSATDPLWYKDAIIYEIHVRAFMDANNDGIGDFAGLMSKLDYLQELGVTCLWLLPFFPSPLRDDGYDIANYTDVNPSYGSVDDFKQFLDAAHQRGMQVMIELVINHTSDQHPWFQAARLAPPGSPERDMYVWSDTDKLYSGVRIIFTDTEKSNWTWDDQAKAFYWHRFFAHQPDLNFDNPRVMEEVIKAMRFWLDMGVDALRLDAIPYLVERDGTSCENVPETHVKIKEIRKVIDAEYENRLVLAEANMWPADVRPYFGDADECHMAFHFPLMPRIYMALRQEDRLPITDIMAQTPDIPETCQWGLFLRNHDELTLEMVTDDERDYMNLAYAADTRMRINVGIRRRLAPLVDNSRRRIELLNSLLLSFPGTPIMYYGDEIGMGDNIYLGDRNGVRTPMQWNPDRNAGFSKAVPGKLYFPVIMDPIWGYQAINVEAQQTDPSSLLHWTRNMIALRKLFKVFGRGTLEFLHPENRTILAYIRHYDDPAGGSETVVCVSNLSRFAQPVSLDLSRFRGMQPVEMLGYVSFPRVTGEPYPLTLAPYSSLWLELQPSASETAEPQAARSDEAGLEQAGGEGALLANELGKGKSISALFAGRGLELLQQLLPKYMSSQRWFGAKSRAIASVELEHWFAIPGTKAAALSTWRVNYGEGPGDVYQVPLALSSGAEAEEVRFLSSKAIVASLSGDLLLHDATSREDVRQALLGMVAEDKILDNGRDGTLTGKRSSAFSNGTTSAPARIGSAEQSNTNILYGNKFLLKLFRRLQVGENPDTEIGRFLTEVAHFSRIAPFLGALEGASSGGQTTTVAMLQGLVANEGDGWEWTLEELRRFFESVASLPAPADTGQRANFLGSPVLSEAVREHAGAYIDAAALLGQRTAEMHLALATPTDDPAFSSEAFTAEDLSLSTERIVAQLRSTLQTLTRGLSSLPDAVGNGSSAVDDAALLLSRRRDLMARAEAVSLRSPEASGRRIRIHGDYHLGQILRADGDFVILDFEGEPARSLAERRQKQTPLKDVAGMLRSFSYAAAAGLNRLKERGSPSDLGAAEMWAELWTNAVTSAYLAGYARTIRSSPGLIPAPVEAQSLLDACLLEKALYELLYEINNRPTWVPIPMRGILSLP